MADPRMSDRAVAFLEKARTLAPGRVDIREQLAAAYLQAGNRRGALDETLAAADLLAATDPVSARATLRRALQFAPESTRALRKMAALALDSGAQGEWAELMERAATVCMETQRKGEAGRILQAILDVMPDAVEVRRRLIELQGDLGSDDATLAERLSLARSLESKGDYTKALDEYARVLESWPRNTAALERTAELAAQAGRVETAVECCMRLGEAAAAQEAVLDGEQSDPEARERAQRDQAARLRDAVAWFDRAAQLAPEQPEPRQSALDCLLQLADRPEVTLDMADLRERVRRLAEVCRKSGTAPQAEDWLKRLMDRFPEEAGFREERAALLAASGRGAEAAGILLELGRMPGIHPNAAIAHLDAALQLLREAPGPSPGELETARLLAEALAEGKAKARAVDVYLRHAERVREDADWFRVQNSPRAAGEESLDLCLKARELDGGLPVLRALAQAYLDAGQETSAAQVYAEIAEQQVLLAESEPGKRTEHFRKALAALERADEHHPGDPGHLEKAAELKAHLGDAAGAARTWIELASRFCEQDRKADAAAALRHCDLLEIGDSETLAEVARWMRTAEDAGAADYSRRAGRRCLEEQAPQAAFGHLESALEVHLAAGVDSAVARDWETETADEIVAAARTSGDARLLKTALRTVRNLWRDRGRTEDLIRVLETLIEEDPDDREAREEHCRALAEGGARDRAAGARLAFADWLHDRRETEEALRQVQHARSLGAEGRELAERLIRLYQSAGRHVEAAEECGRLAEALAAEGKRDDALALCAEALDLADDNTHLRARVIDILDRLGEFERAAAECAQLAGQYLESRLVDRAIEMLRRACELDPARTDSRRRLAEIYARENMTRPAVDEFMMLYAQLLHQGHADKGREVLRKVLAIEPEHLQARHALAEQIWLEGDKAGAVEALLQLARTLVEKGEVEKALVAVDEAAIVDAKSRVYKKGAKEIRKAIEDRKRRLTNTEKLTEAQRLTERGKLEEAIALYESLLGDGEDTEARVGLGRACWALGERERAVEHFVQAIEGLAGRGALRQAASLCWDTLELDRRSEPILEILARLDEEAGTLEKAVDTRLNLGDVQAEKGETVRALATYEQALELVERRAREDASERIPYGYVTAKMALARLLAQEKRGGEAAAHLLDLGEIYTENGDLGEACTVLRHAVRMCPEDAEIRERYARTLLRTGQQAEALKELHAAASLHGANVDRALPMLQEILRVNPEDLDTRTTLARLCAEAGRLEAAAREYRLLAAAAERSGNRTAALEHRRRIVELQPRDLPTRLAFAEELARVGAREDAGAEYARAGELYLEQQSPGKAIEMYRKAAELAANTQPVRERIAEILLSQGDREKAVNEWILLGDACQRGGDLAEAQRFFKRVLEADPKDTRALGKQAACLIAAGEHSKAADVYARISDVYAERGILGKATEVLSTALDRFPANADLREKLGMLYEKRGMKEVARKEYQKALEARPMDPQIQARLRNVSDESEEPRKPGRDPAKKKPEAGLYLFGGSRSLAETTAGEMSPATARQGNRDKGLEYFQRKRYARAIPCLEAALAENGRGESDGNPLESMSALAHCYLETGRNADAIALLHRILEQPEGDIANRIELQYLLGLAYHNESRPDEALEAWKSVHAQDPNYRDIQQRILWSRRQQG